MVELGFTKTFADYCVYVRRTALSKSIIILHVDNFAIVGHIPVIHEFIGQFLVKFSIKALGSAKFVVGLQIFQKRGEIALS